MELFLAKLLGLYFVIMGVVVLVRRKAVMPAVKDLMANRGLMLLIGVLEIVAGLALVITYPKINFDITGLLAVVGYMMIVEGIIYISLPVTMVQKMVRRFNRPSWYMAGGVLAIVVGLYLSVIGFGLI